MVHVALNKYDFEKINILEYAFGEGGGGHQKAYAVYAFINVDNCERPLNSPNKSSCLGGGASSSRGRGAGTFFPRSPLPSSPVASSSLFGERDGTVLHQHDTVADVKTELHHGSSSDRKRKSWLNKTMFNLTMSENFNEWWIPNYLE